METQSYNVPFRNYFIKGSGTSYCLINGSSQDESQFVPFKFREYLEPQDRNQNIKDILMAGLYLVIHLQNGKTYKLGSFMNHQQIFKTPVSVFKSKVFIKSISSGWDHTIFRTFDEKFWGLGSNKFLQLSLKEEIKYVTQPQQLNLCENLYNNRAKLFVCGFRQSYFLTQDNHLFGCGESKKYELGVRASKPLSFNQISKTDDQIVKLITSKRAIFALSKKGNLFGMGTNDHGILDHQNEDCILDKCPQFNEKLTKINLKVKDISCGWSHIILLKSDKEQLWLESYGRNNFGQLGRVTATEQKIGQKKLAIDIDIGREGSEINLVSGSQFVFCCKDGQLFGWGWNEHENVCNSKEQIIIEPRKIEYPQQKQQLCRRVWTYPAITIIQTEQNSIERTQIIKQ